MPDRRGPDFCGLRSITLRSTACRGGSWCRTLRRPGRRSRPDRRWRCRRGARRSGIGRSGWRRMRKTESVAQELPFWRGMQREPSLLLSAERLDPARDTLGTAGHLTLTLPAAVTDALLTRVPAAFHGGIDDVLLTGLALAVADWCRRHVQGATHVHIMAAATRCCSISKGTVVRKVSGLCGSLRRRRPDPNGGLVHQPLSGAARSGPARSGGGAVGRACARPGAEDDQGAVAGGARQGAGLWAAALPQR